MNPRKGKVEPLTEEQCAQRNQARKTLKESYQYIENLSEEHIKFLQNIDQNEEHRFSALENKLSQIIGQSGIIFTLIALFIPLFFTELNGIQLAWKVFFCAWFIMGLFFFTRSILKASDTLKINDFPYGRPDINSSLAGDIKDKAMFIENNVKDLITTIEINTDANTKKGNLLMKAHKAFTYGIISIGILGLVLTVLSLFYKTERQPMLFERTEDIENLERSVAESRMLINLMIVNGIRANDSLNIEDIDRRLDSLTLEIRKIRAQAPGKTW